ncbi:MAG: hypothetical protein IPN95_03290 [Bacteroidetes bacterium]|nr:hypothetical protein [Bacteroidota bacterium]
MRSAILSSLVAESKFMQMAKQAFAAMKLGNVGINSETQNQFPMKNEISNRGGIQDTVR